jgi:hypothetical protein
MTLPLRFLAPLAPLVLAACSMIQTPSTPGTDTGRLAFSYETGDCLFGCDIAGRPMMVGTTESIEATSMNPLSSVTISTDDPTIVSTVPLSVNVTCTSSSSSGSTTAPPSCPANSSANVLFQVVAAGIGTTKLHVFQNGAEVDAIGLQVEAPLTLTPTCGQGASANFGLKVGGECSVDWTVLDAEGQTMQASEGMTLAVTNPAVAQLQGLFGSPSASVEGASDSFLGASQLDGIAAGVTTVTVSGGGISGAAVVTVTAK